MNRQRIILMVSLALIAGSLAGLYSFRQLRAPKAEEVKAMPTVAVVVATRDLPVGARLKASDVRLIDWPAGSVPTGTFSKIEDVVDRGLVAVLFKSEPLTEARLASKEGGSGLPVAIPEGMRAVSVRVDDVIGVAGFVSPGTRVDVLATVPGPNGRDDAGTRVILQNIEAVAVDQRVQTPKEGSEKPEKATVITLLVSPEDSEKLVLAANLGKIHLALRNPLDASEAEARGTGLSVLSPVPDPAPVRSAGPVRRMVPVTVESFNGLKKVTTQF